MDKIEEAAKKYSNSIHNPLNEDFEYIEPNIKIELINTERIFIIGAKSPEAKEYWQQGIYTEEDVLDKWNKYVEYRNISSDEYLKPINIDFKEWFSHNK